MAEKTTNYGLTKPTPEEFYDVQVQNENMNIIDRELKNVEKNAMSPIPVLLTSANDLNQIITHGHYYWRKNNKPANAPTDNRADDLTAMRVWTEDGITCTQEIMDMYSGTTHSCVMRRTVDGDECYPWEWVNPPMEIGVEYRTVERYDGEPVFVTLQANGTMTKRTDYHGIIDRKSYILHGTIDDDNNVTLTDFNWDKLVAAITSEENIYVAARLTQYDTLLFEFTLGVYNPEEEMVVFACNSGGLRHTIDVYSDGTIDYYERYFNAETWTFTLENGSTVEKRVWLG